MNDAIVRFDDSTPEGMQGRADGEWWARSHATPEELRRAERLNSEHEEGRFAILGASARPHGSAAGLFFQFRRKCWGDRNAAREFWRGVLLKKRANARPRDRPMPADRSERHSAAGMGKRLNYLWSILGGTTIAMAWWIPQTVASALLGWLSACLLVYAIRSRTAYLPAYCGGLACCAGGFYWIYGTVANFGNFGPLFGALALFLFVTISAVQFLLFAFVHHHQGDRFDALALRSPTALVVSELVSVRLFQWHFGHTQIAFTPVVQVAGLGGAMLVSFLMFWLAEAGVRVLLFRERRWSFLLPVLAMGLSLGYGAVIINRFASIAGEPLNVVLVQVNAPLPKTYDPDATQRNVDRLTVLSRQVAPARSLIVWPEGAIPAYFPAEIGRVSAENPILPTIPNGSALLIGAYCEDENEDRFNAAYAVNSDGTVPPPYFKQVLIPFGETIPFSSTFPFLKEMNRQAGIFTEGKEVKVFELPMRRENGTPYTVKLAPLICYEDTLPALSRKATLKGAELLVNLTYDTWFGQSAAPFEHHLIATFRAIENRRFLVRSTNSGFSAVVDPLGRTVAEIPAFSEGTVMTTVKLLNDKSTYTTFFGDAPWWVLFAVVVAVIAVKWRKRRTPAAEGAASAA
jgi:apolipoprotein N-acyltransferase